ncbi:MAG: C2 family cysteine protease [Planctomycetota bacterium]
MAIPTGDFDASSTGADDIQKKSELPSICDSVTQYVSDRIAADTEYKAYAVYDLDNQEMTIVLQCDRSQSTGFGTSNSTLPSGVTKPNSRTANVEWLGEFLQSTDSGLTRLKLPASPRQFTNSAQLVATEIDSPDVSPAGQLEMEHFSDRDSDVSQRMSSVIDRNHDGFHDRSELQHALSDRSVRGEDAIYVSLVMKHYDALQGLSNDELLFENSGVTVADAAALDAPENRELLKQMRADFQRMAARLHNRPDTLFGTANQPSIHAFRQNQLGDCYLLAVAGSLAELRPDAFRKMFQQNADGTVRVNFRGGYRGQFDVEVPQDGELVSYAEVSNEYGFWPQVLEKAAGRYRLNSIMFGTDPHAAVDDGGTPETAMQLLTGHKTNTDLLIFSSPSSIEATLAKAVAEERASVLMTHPLPMGGLNGTGLAAGHVYSVVGYDAQSRLFSIVDTNKVMELEPTQGDGFIEVSAEQIKAYFSQSVVETHADILWSVFAL